MSSRVIFAALVEHVQERVFERSVRFTLSQTAALHSREHAHERIHRVSDAARFEPFVLFLLAQSCCHVVLMMQESCTL